MAGFSLASIVRAIGISRAALPGGRAFVSDLGLIHEGDDLHFAAELQGAKIGVGKWLAAGAFLEPEILLR
jgi:hypothetical protein